MSIAPMKQAKLHSDLASRNLQPVDENAPMPPAHYVDHLANERTFLAWLRTSFALISLGFAGNRFSEFVVESQTKKGMPVHRHLGGHWHSFGQFGSGMVIFGTVLIFLATYHYEFVRRSINREEILRRPFLIWMASVLAAIFGLTCVFLLVWQ
jgi:putative membrane protein